ncbi:MAG: AAA family ATPase, partial [Clostridiaceae bacterium]
MEIINERYHVINKINENNLFTSYLVKDSFNGDKISELSIITGGNIKEAQVESVFNDFIKLTHIKSKYVIELYKFDVTKNIDNKVVGEIHYLYIKEKFKPDISLYALGKKLNQYEKMDVFIDICRAVYYMHLKGITYGELNPSNILIQWDEKNYKIKLLDYITVQLNKCDCSSINDDFIYKTIDYYKSEKDYYLDFYSLGVILKKLYEQIEDIDYLKKINYIADKLIIPETDGYRGLIDLVADINNMLNTNYALFNIDEMKVLNFNNSLAGRDKELNSVINREKSNLNIDFSKKLILLHGEQGVGKTRFLNEIKFIYNMNKFNIYSYVNTKESSKNQLSPLDEIFCKIISECDIMIFEKYKEYLLEFIPGSVQFSKYTEDKLNDISEKYILFNGIANFIGEFANDKGLVFIIDDVDLADTFTMEFIEYLYVKNINNVKMQFIISYIEGREINNFKFYDFTNKIKKNTDVLDIYLQGLDENNSDIFIENVLDAKYISKEFTSLIYKRTYGNPLFIEETLKIFFEKEYFTIDKNDGKWIDNGVNSNLKKMKMPTYLEKNALNPIKNISKSEYEVLKTLSIFNEDISLKILSKYYEMDIYKIIMSFIKKGILAKKSVNNDEMLYFLNTILKIIIHDKLEEQDKINRHLKLSRVLEEEFANKEFYQDNLLYHLEKSNQMTKVVEYCIKNSNYMDKTNTNLNSIRYLEKAINFYPSNLEIEGKVDLYVKIANKHYSYGRPKDALFYYKEAENIPFSSKDIKLKIDIINKITEVYL